MTFEPANKTIFVTLINGSVVDSIYVLVGKIKLKDSTITDYDINDVVLFAAAAALPIIFGGVAYRAIKETDILSKVIL